MAKKLTCDVLGLPNYFSALLAQKATGKGGVHSLKKIEFEEIWRDL